MFANSSSVGEIDAALLVRLAFRTGFVSAAEAFVDVVFVLERLRGFEQLATCLLDISY